MKKRKPTDATLRNVRASRRAIALLTNRVSGIEGDVRTLARWVDVLRLKAGVPADAA